MLNLSLISGNVTEYTLTAGTFINLGTTTDDPGTAIITRSTPFLVLYDVTGTVSANSVAEITPYDDSTIFTPVGSFGANVYLDSTGTRTEHGIALILAGGNSGTPGTHVIRFQGRILGGGTAFITDANITLLALGR